MRRAEAGETPSGAGTLAPRAVFGRRKGKKLRPGRAAALKQELPNLALDLGRPAPADLMALFPAAIDRVELEIGFGAGEHMVALAEADLGLGTIGAEPFLNGLAKAVATVAEKGLGPRFRLYAGDALALLDWLPERSIDGARLLYPDPWPKKRHWKRRFVNKDNLDRLARCLKPGAEFRFASDWPDYVNWTLIEVVGHGGFDWLAQAADDWRRPWPGWPGTRYEAKALNEGRAPAYLRFRCR